MIYRGQDFLAVLHTHSPHLSKLDQRHTGRRRTRDNLLTGEGVGEDPTIRPRESLVLYKQFNTLWGEGIIQPDG
jgi:hypothetical protein